MPKPRKPKKKPTRKRKPQPDVNQLAARLIQTTIRNADNQ
jgi:hypothetical protein